MSKSYRLKESVIGEIKRLRSEQGLTYKEIGIRLGVSDFVARKYCKGVERKENHVSLTTLYRNAAMGIFPEHEVRVTHNGNFIGRLVLTESEEFIPPTVQEAEKIKQRLREKPKGFGW